jgi:hypothetical protein
MRTKIEKSSMMMPKKWGSTENSLGHVLEELVEIRKGTGIM